MKPWRRTGSQRVERCGIFDLDRVDFQSPDGDPARPFYVIDCPDWINVIPLTASGEVLLVRQFRFGIEDFTLEIPGGMCDPGETPAESARRELREETGFEAERLIEIGWVHPNPPVQNNRCYTFLARDVVQVGPADPDPSETLELVRVPLESISRLISERKITHGLVLAAFQLFERHGLP